MTANPKRTAPPPKKWYQRINRFSYFCAAVLLHLLVFTLVATLVIFPGSRLSEDTQFHQVNIKIPPPPPVPPAPASSAALNAMEPQVTVTPPTSVPSIVQSTSPSNFTVDAKVSAPNLPALKSIPTGSGLAGAGAGTSGSGVGNPFGSASGSDQSLVGTLYDFTRKHDGTPVNTAPFNDIVNDFVRNHWQPGSAYPCYVSHKKIYSNQIFVPVTPDSIAGTAFGSPESSNANWLVHYQVNISSNRSGKFRFLGFGDNVLIAAIDGTVVLDASDKQYLQKNFSKLIGQMHISGPGKDAPTPLFSGDWFDLETAENHRLDIVLGDEGGVTTSGLFIQFQDLTQELTFSDNGAPKTPLFVIGELRQGDREMIQKYLPPECFQTDLVINGSAIEDNP